MQETISKLKNQKRVADKLSIKTSNEIEVGQQTEFEKAKETVQTESGPVETQAETPKIETQVESPKTETQAEPPKTESQTDLNQEKKIETDLNQEKKVHKLQEKKSLGENLADLEKKQE